MQRFEPAGREHLTLRAPCYDDGGNRATSAGNFDHGGNFNYGGDLDGRLRRNLARSQSTTSGL